MAEEKKHAGGRPRLYSKEELAEKLLEWVQKEDSTTLLGFSADYLIDPDSVLNYAKEDPKFFGTYQTVKAIIGKRRERMLSEGKLHQKAYDFTSNLYDRYGKMEKRDDMIFEANLNKENQSQNNEALINQVQALLDQIRQLQDDKKELQKKIKD